MNTEELRKSYKPDKVKILFVGESPPAGGTFFYNANSNLYRNTKKAFEIAHEKEWGYDFLSDFKKMGCYLVDLCLIPVNKGMTKKERKAEHKKGIPALAETIKALKPDRVVVVMKSIDLEVSTALSLAGFSGEAAFLPFPNWPDQRDQYQAGLARLLKNES